MTDEWYWSLSEGKAVPAGERGPSDDVLGPYPSREEAERWQERVAARNEAWDEADERWEGDTDQSSDDDPAP